MAEQAIAEARPSAREVMGNIWDELEAKANEREQTFAEEDEQPEDQADVSHETDVEQAEEVDEADKDEPEEEEPLEAPASWSKDDREVWARLDRDTQEIIRRRETERDTKLNGSSQELADLKRQVDGWNEIVAPFRRDMELRGIDPHSFTRSLYAAHTHLTQNPVPAMTWLMKQYRVDPEALVTQLAQDGLLAVDNQEDEDVDPEILTLRRKIAELEGRQTGVENGIQASRSQAETQQAQALQQAADSFASARDGDSLLHPHFEAVRGHMGGLLSSRAAEQALRDEGTPVTVDALLQKAYDMAVWADPKLRPTLLESHTKAEIEALKQQQEAEAKERAKREADEKKAKAKDARKSAVGVKSRSQDAGTEPRKESRRETLSRLYDELSAA